MVICPKCKCKLDFHLVSNLYWCNACRYVLVDEGEIKLDATDLRKYTMSWDCGWEKVYSYIYQLDLLKIINMAQHLNCNRYADWLRKVIIQVDKIEKRETDFNRLNKLPRVFLKDYLDVKH